MAKKLLETPIWRGAMGHFTQLLQQSCGNCPS